MEHIKNILDFQVKSYNQLFPASIYNSTIISATIFKYNVTNTKLIEIQSELKKMVTSFQYVNQCLQECDDIIRPYYHDLVIKAASNIENLLKNKKEFEEYLEHLKSIQQNDNKEPAMNLITVTNKINEFRDKPYHYLFPAHAPFASFDLANAYRKEITMAKIIENENDIKEMVKYLQFIKSYEDGCDESSKDYYMHLIEKAQKNIMSLNKSKNELESYLSYLQEEYEKISTKSKESISWEHIQ